MGRFTPVAAIHHAPEHILHALALYRLFRLFDDHFQEVVGFFQFIVEAQVVLGQLEFLIQIAFLRHLFPQQVQGGE